VPQRSEKVERVGKFLDKSDYPAVKNEVIELRTSNIKYDFEIVEEIQVVDPSTYDVNSALQDNRKYEVKIADKLFDLPLVKSSLNQLKLGHVRSMDDFMSLCPAVDFNEKNKEIFDGDATFGHVLPIVQS
jgi:hypothetical protein